MATQDRWNRRRVLVLAGGMSALAGCSTEDESADGSEPDGENETDGSDDGDDGDDAESDSLEDETDEDDGESDSLEEDDDAEAESEETNEDGEPAEEPELSEFTLRVVDANGDPAEAMLVVGEGEPHDADIPLEFTGVTGSEGYHHNVIYENEYTIEIDHPDYEGTTIEHTHDGPSEATAELDVVVGDDSAEDDEPSGDDEAKPEHSDLTVRAVDPNGDPIQGAVVSGEGEPHEADIPLEFTGITGGDGYHHNLIYENEYTIEVDHSDYEPTTVEHTHDGDHELTVELEAEYSNN